MLQNHFFKVKLSSVPWQSSDAYELCDHLLCSWLPLLPTCIYPSSAAGLQPHCWGQEGLRSTRAHTKTGRLVLFLMCNTCLIHVSYSLPMAEINWSDQKSLKAYRQRQPLQPEQREQQEAQGTLG